MIKSNNLELILIKTPNYLQEKSCIGCSYFKQTKGHFGQCVAALDKKNNPSNKYYDGTRIGSACSLYRTSIILPENTQVTTEEEQKKERLKFNEDRKSRRKRIRVIKSKKSSEYAKHGLNEMFDANIRGFKEPKFTDYYHGLPFQLTTELGQTKKGYYGHQYNHHVINYAISLFKSETPTKEVRKRVGDYYKVNPSDTTLRQWRFKFLHIKPLPFCIDINNKQFGLFWKIIDYKINLPLKINNQKEKPLCPICKSNTHIQKRGKRYNDNSYIQKFACTICHKWFTVRGSFLRAKTNELILKQLPELFDSGKTTREIQSIILKEYDVKISHKTISDWLRRFNPQIQFNTNGSHKAEVKSKISQGVKLYFKTHPGIMKGKKRGSYKTKWMKEMEAKYSKQLEYNKPNMEELVICR